MKQSERERSPTHVAATPTTNVIQLPTSSRQLERALIEGLEAGDPIAIAKVYRQHHRKVRAFSRRMLRDDMAAEDVVHDVFVALPDAISRFRGDSALSVFLISIAVNICRHRIRSAVRGRRAAEKLHARNVPVPVATPETETRRRRLAEALERGLETLPLEQREVFVLCAAEERTSFEVAQILSIPDGTVRTRLRYARKKLRTFLVREGLEREGSR